VTQREKDLLVNKYAVGPLDVNYLAFFRDIEGLSSSSAPPKTWSFTSRDPHGNSQGFSAEMTSLIERLRVGFYRSRVRPIDFFADHDKLRSGLVTENQFICGLSLALSAHNAAVLSREEQQSVAAEFLTQTGHVRYRDFCNITDNGENFQVNV
jgi:hypothetical protein